MALQNPAEGGHGPRAPSDPSLLSSPAHSPASSQPQQPSRQSQQLRSLPLFQVIRSHHSRKPWFPVPLCDSVTRTGQHIPRTCPLWPTVSALSSRLPSRASGTGAPGKVTVNPQAHPRDSEQHKE